jgi:hypothetical protein
VFGYLAYYKQNNHDHEPAKTRKKANTSVKDRIYFKMGWVSRELPPKNIFTPGTKGLNQGAPHLFFKAGGNSANFLAQKEGARFLNLYHSSID